MKLLYKLTIVLLYSCLSLSASDIQNDFLKGNDALSNDKFEEAIQHYENALQSGVSVPLYFNLGNAYYETGNTGLAVLNYEKALTINPSAPEPIVNLKYIRDKHFLSATHKTLKTAFANTFPLNIWIWITSVSFWIFTALILLPRLYGRVPVSIKIIRFCSFLILGTGIFAMTLFHNRNNEAIIIKNEAALRLAPTTSSSADVFLKEGDMVTQQKSHGNYIQIKTLKKQTGWVSNDEVKRIWESINRNDTI